MGMISKVSYVEHIRISANINLWQSNEILSGFILDLTHVHRIIN